MTSEARKCRLCLTIQAGEGANARLAIALAAATVAAVVIAPATDAALTAGEVAPLIAAIQAEGTAALVLDDARLARTLKADGVHIAAGKRPLETYATAREIVGSRAIVGVDAGRTRHDAMEIGETGTEYVAFGIPDFVTDRAAAVARRLELIAWWSEIFEIPCVAFDVTTIDDAAALARAGADFVNLRLPVGLAGAELRDLVVEAATAMSATGRS